MRSYARTVLTAVLLVLLLSGLASALIEPVTRVEAGRSGAPPYELASVSVGDYTVDRELLVTGRSTGSTLFASRIEWADNFDLNSVATRNRAGAWTITRIGGQATWSDRNGQAPDFLLFEAGMNDTLTVQAILPGGVLGEAVSIPTSVWGDTGLVRVGLMNSGQRIGGLAFSITDLLDANGQALGLDAVIEGIRIDSGDVDPAHFSAIAPEPATFAILGLGCLVMIRYRRSS